jgi:hypothetical protein
MLEKIKIGDTNTVALQKIFNILKNIDKHDHSINQGVIIKFSDIVIEGDLDFKNNSLHNVKSLTFTDTIDNIPEDKDLLYFYDGNLFIKHQNSPAIQLTANGEFNSSLIGGISGDYSNTPSSIIYDSVANTFFFTENSLNPSNIKANSIRLYNDEGNYTELRVSNDLTLDFSIVFPPTAPSSSSVLALDPEGNLNYVSLTTPSGVVSVVKNNIDGSLNSLPISLELIQNITGSPYLLIQINEEGKLSPVTNSAYRLPSGRTIERPSTPVEGMLRFNTTDNLIEYYNGLEWRAIMTSAGTEGLSIDDLSDVALDGILPFMYLRYDKDDVNPEMSRWRPSFLSKYDWALEPYQEGETEIIPDGVVWGKPSDVTDLSLYSVADFNNTEVINPEFDVDPEKVLEDLGEYRLCLVDYPSTPALYKLQIYDETSPFNFRDYNPLLDVNIQVRWDLYKTETGDVFESIHNQSSVDLFEKYQEWGDVITVFMRLYVDDLNNTSLQRHPRLSLPDYVKYPVPILNGSCIIVTREGVLITPNIVAGSQWGDIVGTFDPITSGLSTLMEDKIPATEGVSYNVVTPSTSIFDFDDVVGNDLLPVDKDTLLDNTYLINKNVLGSRKFICTTLDPFPLEIVGDLYAHNGVIDVRLPSLNRPSFLTADSTTEIGLKWDYNSSVGVDYPKDDLGNPVADPHPTEYYFYGSDQNTHHGVIGSTGIDVISDIMVYNKGLTSGEMKLYHGDPNTGGQLILKINTESSIGYLYSDLREFPNKLYIETMSSSFTSIKKSVSLDMDAVFYPGVNGSRNNLGTKEVNPYQFKMLSIGSDLNELIYGYTIENKTWKHLVTVNSNFTCVENTDVPPSRSTETEFSNVRPLAFCKNNYSFQNTQPFVLTQVQVGEGGVGAYPGNFFSTHTRSAVKFETAVFKSPVPLSAWMVGKTALREVQSTVFGRPPWKIIGYEGIFRWKTSYAPWLGTNKLRTWRFDISANGEGTEVTSDLISSSTYVGSFERKLDRIPTRNSLGVMYTNDLEWTWCSYIECTTPNTKGLFHPTLTGTFDFSHHYTIDSTDFMYHYGGGQGNTKIVLGSCHDELTDFLITQVTVDVAENGGMSNATPSNVKSILESIFQLEVGDKLRGFNYQENGVLLLATWLKNNEVYIGRVDLSSQFDMSTAVGSSLVVEKFGNLTPIKPDYDERQKTLVPFLEEKVVPHAADPDQSLLYIYSIVSKKNKVRSAVDNSELIGSSSPVKYTQRIIEETVSLAYGGDGVVIALRNKHVGDDV